jgi:hypothetical protein
LNGRRPLEAEQIVREILRADPRRATRALFVLGAAQLTQGHVDDAITTLENAVRIKHDAEIDTIFTFLAPLFGVAAGHFVLNDPLTPPFALAVVAVAVGILLVNRPR